MEEIEDAESSTECIKDSHIVQLLETNFVVVDAGCGSSKDRKKFNLKKLCVHCGWETKVSRQVFVNHNPWNIK